MRSPVAKMHEVGAKRKLPEARRVGSVVLEERRSPSNPDGEEDGFAVGAQADELGDEIGRCR